jgi:membrane-bound lytic murein transglycosylase MltF
MRQLGKRNHRLRKNEALELNTQEMQKPWQGDLPGMLDRRVIRVLTTYSKTFFFIDKGTQRGATHDIFIEYERNLNQQLMKEKKLKHRHLKVRIISSGGPRPAFQRTRCRQRRYVAANLTVTEERQQQADFTIPLYSNVQELLLSGPGSPEVANLEQLSGKEVFVRQSSSYYQSLVALNAHFAKESRPPVIIAAAPESLEDEV